MKGGLSAAFFNFWYVVQQQSPDPAVGGFPFKGNLLYPDIDIGYLRRDGIDRGLQHVNIMRYFSYRFHQLPQELGRPEKSDQVHAENQI